MISAKRLEELQAGGCLVPAPGRDASSCHEYNWKLCDCEIHELIELANIGQQVLNKAIEELPIDKTPYCGAV